MLTAQATQRSEVVTGSTNPPERADLHPERAGTKFPRVFLSKGGSVAPPAKAESHRGRHFLPCGGVPEARTLPILTGGPMREEACHPET